MLKFTEYVKASDVWATAKNYTDNGEVTGLMRGYNIEVEKDGQVDWLSSEWVYGTPEEAFDDDFHRWWFDDMGVKLTGRICFRGYGLERYDFEERDTYVVICDSHGRPLE